MSGITVNGPSAALEDPNWTAPTGAKAQTLDRRDVIATATALATGRLSLFGIYLKAGTLVSTISFLSGATAAVTPTAQWFALYSAARGKLGVTSDDTTTAWGANVVKSLNLASPVAITASGLYYVGCMVAAATVPTLRGVATLATASGLAPILEGSADSALTTPATAPVTATALTAQGQYAYAYVS